MGKQAFGRVSMIATGNPLAASAAQKMLDLGGSAIDAAIAADAVLGVVEPMATSIGGDLLAMLVHPDGSVLSYNGTGRAPLGLSADDVARLPNQKIPERHPLSVTTPGAVRGWHDLHSRYGRLDWRLLFDDAIQLARDGFAVAPIVAHEWQIFDHVLHNDAYCAQLYRAGHSPRAGEQFVNTDLARVLEGIAAEGYQSFYSGAVAHAAAQAVQAHGGVLATADFEQHTGDFRPALSTPFCGAVVHQCPPNTHGVAVLDALQEMQTHDFEPGSPQAAVQLVNATASAMRRASETVADPAGNTVCTVIVDADGLAITLMSSTFKRFGSGIAVPGGGFVLQNRGFGFAAPGHINGAAPGKRPYHTVVPGATTRNGKFLLGMGVVGGLMQPQGQLQILTRVLAGKEELQAAVNAPRWRLEAGNTLAIEAGMPASVEAALRAAGYSEPAVNVGELGGRSDFGGAQVVLRADDGGLVGASDPRKDGISLGK
ncbi:MAG: gamma-glutamyltransferase [Burkholderiaceae bacterium]|nr:gamma-glutamyltransferase [Burkholderiaceae bacterium]